MKEVLIAITLLLSAPYSSSSQEFKIGIAGAFNTTMLFNSNVGKANEAIDYKISLGEQGGINMTYDLQDMMGLGMSILFSVHNQKYSVSGNDIGIKTSLKYIDIPVLFRVGIMDQGAYFEAGPQIGILAGATEDYITSSPGNLSYSGRNVKRQFNSLDLAGVIGIGGLFDVSETVAMTAGLRFGYSFTDATKEFNETELARLKLAGATSFADLAAHYNTGTNISYQPTNRAFAGIFISAMYMLRK